MGLDLLESVEFLPMTKSPAQSPRHTWCDRRGPWLFAALALAPLIWCRAQFAELFWFGDDWDLLDQITRIGFWHWTWTVFAENFVPLFKVAWGAAVFGGGGSYFPMIVALWITHALNVALLGKLLRESGFGWAATGLVLIVFGLTSANIETLGWSVQWSANLAVTFFLAAARWFLRQEAPTQAWSWRVHGILAALIAASALSFSRGVLTGAALAAVSFVRVAPGPWLGRSRLLTGVVCLLPCAVVAGCIYVFAGGNHHRIGAAGQLSLITQFSFYYLGMNPLYRLLEWDSWGPYTAVLLGTLKLALILWSLRRSEGRVRRLLLLFVLLDLGNAALLGLGRYHTGMAAATGSRYQYNALLCTLPFLGYWFEAMLERWLGERATWRMAAASLLVLVAGWRVARPWPDESRQWAAWRGTTTRDLLFRNAQPPATGAIPGIDFMTTPRAKELVTIYRLH